ncbi:Tetratricopeptide repeat-containing protein [Streptomyces sp. Ag109_G2-15]|nr:Tetratricopeptide repeat-containing protein [Streptomyces sp. Ag109_G2-15]
MDDLPAVAANLEALATLLRSPDVWGLPEQNCVVVLNPTTPQELVRPIDQAATEATDALLVYYAGHGLPTPGTLELHLALTGSEPNRSYTSVPYGQVKEQLVKSRARRRIVVLDCCYSGRALGMASGEPAMTVAQEARAEGTYVIAAAAETKKAISVPGEPYTAFTGELLDVLSRGIPDAGRYLDLDTLFKHLDQSLRAKRRPVPQRAVRNTADRVTFPNRAYDPDLEAERASRKGTPPTAGDQRARILQTLIESSPTAREVRLAALARGPVADVATLAELLPKAGMWDEVSDFLRQAVQDRPVHEIVGLVSSLTENQQSHEIEGVLTEAAARPVPELVDLITELPTDSATTLLTLVGRSSSAERLVELTKTLRARGLHPEASTVLSGVSRSSVVVDLVVALGREADGSVDVECLLHGSQRWDWLERSAIAVALRRTSLKRTTWRQLLRRHAPYAPKSLSMEFVRTLAIVYLWAISVQAVADNTSGQVQAVAVLSGAIPLCIYGIYAAYKTILTDPLLSTAILVVACSVSFSLPITTVLQYATYAGLSTVGLCFLVGTSRGARRKRAWYHKVIMQHRLNAPLAMQYLADLETAEGNDDTARGWYTRAAATKDTEVAAQAMLNLGTLEERQGAPDTARDWYTKAAATKHTKAAAQAMLNLGTLEERQGAPDTARDWYTRAITTERAHARESGLTGVLLDVTQPWEGRVAATIRGLCEKAAAKRAHAAPWAMFNLGTLEERQGAPDIARDWYTKAAATKNDEAASSAAEALARLTP